MDFEDILKFVEENKKEYFDKMIAINQLKLTIRHLEKVQEYFSHDTEYGIEICINNLKDMIEVLEK